MAQAGSCCWTAVVGSRHADPDAAAILVTSSSPAGDDLTPIAGDLPFAPTADFDMLHGIVHDAKQAGIRLVVGPVASLGEGTSLDDPRGDTYERLGALAVDRFAAVLFTAAAAASSRAGAMLVPSSEPPETVIALALAAAVASPKR